MLKALKTQVFQMIARPEAGRFLADRQRGRGVIFMLHRFACAENNWQGYDVPMLRRFLAYLRASRAQLVPVDQLLAAFEAGIDPTAAPMIAFTIDDGFADFGNHGVPAFAEYDCPTTVFVVPNVIAGKTWFWWNKVEYILDRTRMNAIDVDVVGRMPTATPANRASAIKSLQSHIKTLPASGVTEYIERLAISAEVSLPVSAPAEYAVHDWNTLRALSSSGVTVGAHSMNHPILSRCSHAEVQAEIEESIARVRAECPNATEAFCYPNGFPGVDFTERETSILARSPARWALSAREGILNSATKNRIATQGAGRFLIPRIGIDDDLGRSCWLALGKQFTEPVLWS